MSNSLISRLLIVAFALVGCAGTRPERSYIVSSESSYYSPVVRLAIAVDTTVDSVIVAIDSGTIRAHGIADSPSAVMRDLTIEAIIVRAPRKAAIGERLVEPWTALAVSPPAPLLTLSHSAWMCHFHRSAWRPRGPQPSIFGTRGSYSAYVGMP